MTAPVKVSSKFSKPTTKLEHFLSKFLEGFLFLIPPQKNVFGLFTETLIQQALKDNIVHKTYQEFVERVKNTMLNSSATK